MNTQISWVMITRYLAGESTLDEKEIIESWSASDHENREKLESLKDIWEESGKRGKEHDAYSALHRVNRKINFAEKVITRRVGKSKLHVSDYWSSVMLLRIAASIAFILMIAATALYISGVFNNKPDKSYWNEAITRPGQRLTITLNDGTTITLNAESKLKYPKSFHEDARVIYLEGEAYFKVAHVPNKPFIVRTGKLTTIDLGTVFNIKAYPDENNFSVSLVRGKVSVSQSHSNKAEDAVILKPGEQYSYNKTTGTGKVKPFDYLQAAGWKDNILVFKSDRLSDILVNLERAYGIKFELDAKDFASFSVTANFNKTSLPTILDALKKLTGLKYKIKKAAGIITKVIYFNNRKPIIK